MLQTKEEISSWLDSMDIKGYTINQDLTVDVKGSVELNEKELNEIPIQFGTVEGHFNIWNNNLTSLKGSPRIVTGNFDCAKNKLKSLEYCAEAVGNCFFFNLNPIETLQHLPILVGMFAIYDKDATILDITKLKVKRTFLHECQLEEQCMPLLKNYYKPKLKQDIYKFSLSLSAQELESIQTNIRLERELRTEIVENKDNNPKKAKI